VARSGRPVMHIEGGTLRRISSRGAVA
jgi:hypothetical protein